MSNQEPNTKKEDNAPEQKGFFGRIFEKVDASMKQKAEEKAKQGSCCGGKDDKGDKGGKCC